MGAGPVRPGGMGNGVMTIVRGALPAERYGRAHYGALNGAPAVPVLLSLTAVGAGAALRFAVAVRGPAAGPAAATSARSGH